MKTVYAPDTTAAYVETFREAAIANPAISFIVLVAITGVLAHVCRDWF